MDLSINQKLIITLPCPVCDAVEGHKHDCESEKIRTLDLLNTRIDCPICSSGKIGINQDDYYECRDCHTQFSSSPLTDSEQPEKTTLIDSEKDTIMSVFILEAKGVGRFPLDEAIKKLQKKIRKIMINK